MAAQEAAQSVPEPFRDDLYFIQAGRNGPVKIGRTKEIKARMRMLRSANANELTLLRLLKGRGWEEPIWHKVFEDFRLRGEWFEPCPTIWEAAERASFDREWWEMVPIPCDRFEVHPDDPDYENKYLFACEDWHGDIQDERYALWAKSSQPAFQP